MQVQFRPEDRAKIESSVREKYSLVAKNASNQFKYPTGLEGLQTLRYDSDFIGALPESVSVSYCGVGNPFALGQINKDSLVLDIGCGAGVDSIAAARQTGPDGVAMGVDITFEMLRRSRANASAMKVTNVFFFQSSAEMLPFSDSFFDIVISNGALNLVIDKQKAFSEIFRTLKPGGRMMVADEILTGQAPKNTEDAIKSWFR